MYNYYGTFDGDGRIQGSIQTGIIELLLGYHYYASRREYDCDYVILDSTTRRWLNLLQW